MTRCMLSLVIATAIALGVAACGGDDDNTAARTSPPSTSSTSTTSSPPPSAPASSEFALRSDAFADGEAIPKRYTCDGENISPPLSWSGAPNGTAQLALIMDDPDAPSGTFVHWVAWGFGPDPGATAAGSAPTGAREGKNGAGQDGYTGPCPPSGVHHYRFQLYALREAVALQPGIDAATLRAAIGDVTLASTTLTGTYQRG